MKSFFIAFFIILQVFSAAALAQDGDRLSTIGHISILPYVAYSTGNQEYKIGEATSTASGTSTEVTLQPGDGMQYGLGIRYGFSKRWDIMFEGGPINSIETPEVNNADARFHATQFSAHGIAKFQLDRTSHLFLATGLEYHYKPQIKSSGFDLESIQLDYQNALGWRLGLGWEKINWKNISWGIIGSYRQVNYQLADFFVDGNQEKLSSSNPYYSLKGTGATNYEVRLFFAFHI